MTEYNENVYISKIMVDKLASVMVNLQELMTDDLLDEYSRGHYTAMFDVINQMIQQIVLLLKDDIDEEEFMRLVVEEASDDISDYSIESDY